MHNTKWLWLHTVFFRGHHKCLNWRVLDLDKSLDVKWNVFKKERSSVVWEPTRHYFRGHVFIQFIFHLSTLYRNFFFPSWKWKVFWAHLNKIAEMAQEVKKKNPKYIAREDMCGVKCWRSDICRLSLQAWTCYLSLREKVFRLRDKCRQCSSLRAVRCWDV